MDLGHWILAALCVVAAGLCVRLQMRITRAEEHNKSLEQARTALQTLQEDVSAKFQALADTALRQSQEQFLQIAGQTLGKEKEGISGDLRELLKPVEKKFGEFGQKVDDIRKVSIAERQQMKDQLTHIGGLLMRTSEQTTKLTSALSAPKGGGRWGEETLRNVMELAGMSEYCDFEEQTNIRTDDGASQRPDVIVRLPGGRKLVIDSKAPLDKYLAAADEADAETRERYLSGHAKAVRTHYRSLAAKGYWRQFDTAPDFVAMFIPGENFYSEALKRDRTLFDDAARDSVIIVTPATLVALAKAIAFGWRQEKASRNAEHTAELGRELHKRMKTMLGYMKKMTSDLNRTVESYNQLVGSMEGRIMPAARRFEDLGLSSSADSLPEIEQVDTQARLPNT